MLGKLCQKSLQFVDYAGWIRRIRVFSILKSIECFEIFISALELPEFGFARRNWRVTVLFTWNFPGAGALCGSLLCFESENVRFEFFCTALVRLGKSAFRMLGLIECSEMFCSAFGFEVSIIRNSSSSLGSCPG